MRYEVPDDLRCENEILAEILKTEWGSQWTPPRYDVEKAKANPGKPIECFPDGSIKLSGAGEMRYHADFAMRDNRSGHISAFIEIKDRKNWRGFDSIILDLFKWKNLCILAETSGLPVFFCPRLNWDNGNQEVLSLRVRKELIDVIHIPIRWNGRTDRGDWNDLHPCLELPVKSFNKVATIRMEGEA